MFITKYKNLLTALFLTAVLLVSDVSKIYGAGFYGEEEFRINTYTNGNSYYVAVAQLYNGNIFVTWNTLYESEYGVYAQLFDTNGVRIGSEFQVDTYSEGSQFWPAVTNLNNGNFVVAWDSHGPEQDGSVDGIYAQLFNMSGNKIGDEFRVNTYTVSYQKKPEVTTLNNSNFVVIWRSCNQDGDGWGIFAQIFSMSGTKIGNEFQINTYTNNQQTNPVIASLNNSNFVVVWHSYGQDGFENGIYAQILNASGNKVGTEFQVNTYITGDQAYPSVATLTNNN